MDTAKQDLPDMPRSDFEKALLGSKTKTPGCLLPEMLVQLAGRYLEENYDKLYELCFRVCKNEDQALEVLNAVVYFRLPCLIERWEPSKGSFEAFAFYSLRLYIWKYRQRAYDIAAKVPSFSSASKEFVAEEELPGKGSDETTQVANKEIIRIALNRLEDYPRWLVVARIVDELSFDEMAEKLGVSKGTAFNHYSKAYIQLRKILRELAK
jgi:RNA polymerase sigma factor (sigma-70 family)